MSGQDAGGAEDMEDDDVDIICGDVDVDLGEDDEELNFVDDGSARDADTNQFDCTIGALEDILMDPEFEEERETFCRSNCAVFEDTDENKLAYTDVFQRYTHLVETNIERRLHAAVPNFDMHAFLQVLDSRKEELTDVSDVFDLLLSMGDFDAFKGVMLSYKKEDAEGGRGHGGLDLITCRGMPVHTEEQEDGDARPDLDFGLTVSKPSGSRAIPPPAAPKVVAKAKPRR